MGECENLMEIKTTYNMTNNRYGSLRRHSTSDSERWALYQSDYLPQYHYRENPNASIWFIILVFTSFLLGAGIATALLLMNADDSPIFPIDLNSTMKTSTTPVTNILNNITTGASLIHN